MGASARPSEPHADAHAASATPAAAAIDIEKLTDKVYRLLLADVRLELARRGGTAERR